MQGEAIIRQQTVGVRLVAVILAVAIPLAAAMLFLWWTALQDGRARQLRLLEVQVAQVERDLRKLWSDADWFMSRMASRPPFRNLSPEACGDEIVAGRDINPAFLGITLWSRGGELVCSTFPVRAGQPAPAPYRKAFDEGMAADGLYLSGIFAGPITGLHISTFTFPVKDDAGAKAGLLSIPVRAEFLERLLHDLDRLPGSAAGVTDREFRLVARVPAMPEVVGKSVAALSGLAAGFESRAGAFEATGVDGVKRVIAHKAVPDSGWHVYVGVEDEVLYSGFRRQLVQGLVAFAAVIAFSLGIAYLLSRAISRPLRQLVAVADSVAQGDHTARAAPDGAVEIALLTEHLNRMLDALERSDKALRDGNRRLRELSGRLLGAQEEERLRISRGLHDQIGQELSVLKIQLDTLAPTIADPAQRARVKAIAHAASETLQRVRQISVDLRPPQLDSLGLEVALRVHVERQAALGRTAMHFESGRLPRLAEEAEIRCFRIAQESLTNVLRHAQARNAWVSLDLREGNLVLTVRDDGVGFDAEAARGRGGVGLLGMQERMALAGGTLDIRSEPAQGCTVTATFPLSGSGA
jgi:signal transduction histidine kinase